MLGPSSGSHDVSGKMWCPDGGGVGMRQTDSFRQVLLIVAAKDGRRVVHHVCACPIGATVQLVFNVFVVELYHSIVPGTR